MDINKKATVIFVVSMIILAAILIKFYISPAKSNITDAKEKSVSSAVLADKNTNTK